LKESEAHELDDKVQAGKGLMIAESKKQLNRVNRVIDYKMAVDLERFMRELFRGADGKDTGGKF